MRSLETGNIVVLGLEEMGCFSRANVKIDESTCISLLTLNGPGMVPISQLRRFLFSSRSAPKTARKANCQDRSRRRRLNALDRLSRLSRRRHRVLVESRVENTSSRPVDYALGHIGNDGRELA